jgi:hypothetical protein
VVEQVAAGPWCGRPGRPEWYDLLDDNAATVGAALDAALAGTASDDVLLTVARLALYWNDRMHVVEGGRLAERAARRAVPPDRFPAAAAVGAHGMLLALAQRMVTARPLLEAALAAAPRSPRVAEAGHLVVQWAAAAWAGDDWPLAARAADLGRRLGERADDPHTVLVARAVGAAAATLIGRPAAGTAEATGVLADNADVGNDFAALVASVALGVAAALAGDADGGLHWTAETLRHQLRLGNRDLGDTFEQRGGHYARAGRPLDAVRCYAAAHAHQQRVGRRWPRHAGTAERLAEIVDRVDTGEYERAWRAGQRLGTGDLALELA